MPRYLTRSRPGNNHWIVIQLLACAAIVTYSIVNRIDAPMYGLLALIPLLMIIDRSRLATALSVLIAVLSPLINHYIVGSGEIAVPFLVGPQLGLVLGAFWVLVVRQSSVSRVLLSKRDLLILPLLILPLLATLVSNYTEYLHLIGLYWLNVVYMYVLILHGRSRSGQGLFDITLPAVIAGYVGIIVVLMMNPGAGRFSMDGNVRAVANLIGLALLILVLSYAANRRGLALHLPFARHRILAVLAIMSFLAVLVATASRGVLLALGVSALMVVLGSVAWSYVPQVRGPLRRRSPPWLLMVAAPVMLWVSYEYLIGMVADQSSVVARFERSVSVDLRPSIWAAGLSQLDSAEWLFGAGMNRFPSYSDVTNAPYAHSVFIDFLVSFGLIGLIAVMSYIFALAWRMFVGMHWAELGVVFYLALSYSTHGHVTTISFWLLLAVISVLSTRPARITGT